MEGDNDDQMMESDVSGESRKKYTWCRVTWN
jgi:hypothetical protein